MTNQAAIQAHISKGYGVAAEKLGAMHSLYCPTDPTIAALDPSTLVSTIEAGFDIDYRFSHRAPAGYNHPVYFVLANLAVLATGNYLSGPSGSYFIANMEPLRPPLAVRTNRTVCIYEPRPPTPGPDFYSGNVGGTGTAKVMNWPVSMLLGPKGEINQSALPADPRAPWYAVLFPPVPGLVLRTGDVMIDEIHRRFTVSAIEQSMLGHRLTVSYSGT